MLNLSKVDTQFVEFRTKVLGANNATIGEELADRFIRSPLARLLDLDEFCRVGGVNAITMKSRVQWRFTNGFEEDLEPLTKSNTVRWLVRPDQLEYAQFFGAIVELPDAGISMNTGLLAPMKYRLPAIPFMPASESDNVDDQSFPVVFPGTAVHLLRTVSESLSISLPWERALLARFILIGKLPIFKPVCVRVFPSSAAQALRMGHDPACQPNETVEQDANARRRVMKLQIDLYSNSLQGGMSARGEIRVQAEPWVSGETIKAHYAHYQREMLRRFNTQRNVTHLHGSAKRSEVKPLPRHPTKALASRIKAVAEAIERGFGNSSSMRKILVAHSGETDKKRAYSYSARLRGYKSACELLDLPHDISRLIRTMRNNEYPGTTNSQNQSAQTRD